MVLHITLPFQAYSGNSASISSIHFFKETVLAVYMIQKSPEFRKKKIKQTKLSTSDNLTLMIKNRQAVENELEGVCVLTSVISNVNSAHLYICIARNHDCF